MVLDKGVEMKYEQIKNILLTNGYTTQDYKNEILWYIDKIQQENKQLKMINKEYERLNNGKPRGFVITRVDEYDVYDLLRYKENWNKLKEWASNFYNSEEVGWAGCGMRYTLEKMQELERSENK